MTPSPWLSCSVLLGLMLCVCFVAEASRVFKVGDEFGWRVPADNDTALYSHWATTNRFHIGDSISFAYENDSVIQVDKWGYYHCNGSDPITAFDNGNSTVELDRPGAFYFISGFTTHCKSGQRVIVQVMHIHPPTIAAPPVEYSSMAPSPLSASAAFSTYPFPSLFSFLIASVLIILCFNL